LNLTQQCSLLHVFKRSNHATMSNYRPIYTPKNFAKLFEFIIYDHVPHHAKFSRNQHGFTRTKSTVTNLVIFLDFFTLLSAVGVRLMLYILIFVMLSTLSLIIFSCINLAPSDSLMLMLAGFAAT
jgi:hypothetical protein